MRLRMLCAVLALGRAITVAWADPVVLGPFQMDAVTAAGADAYAAAQANATGQSVFSDTNANAVALNGLLPQTSYGGGAQAGAMASATGPSAYIEASAKAAYGSAGEAIALAVATGTSTFAALSAGVASIDGQAYLIGSLAGDPAPGQVIATSPIAFSTASGMVWSPPTMRPTASMPPVSVASSAVSGGELVSYTLTTGDQDGGTGDSATLSLSFFKPPGSRIPPLIAIDISGVVPVVSDSLIAKPAAM